MTKGNRHHGLALMLVIAVIAMASLIGMAMLSNASLQAQAAGSHENAAEADYLAESAVQTAGYYLQRGMAGMPSDWEDTPGYTIYAQDVTVSGVDGSFDLSVAPTTTPDVYQIVATGRSGGSSPLTRTITAQVKTIRATPAYSGGFGGATTINLGNFFAGAPISVDGLLAGTGLANLLDGSRARTTDDYAVPSVGTGDLNYYGADTANGTYLTPSGQVGTAQILSSGNIASPATLTALPTNPGKVFYYAGGPVFISGPGTYTGTLISRNKIEINPPLGSTIVWKREPGFPAMMSDGTFVTNARSLNMTINGVVFAGGGTAFGSPLNISGTSMKINGALLVPANKIIGAGGLGTMTVTYTPSNNDIQNMTTTPQPTLALKYLSWDQ